MLYYPSSQLKTVTWKIKLFHSCHTCVHRSLNTVRDVGSGCVHRTARDNIRGQWSLFVNRCYLTATAKRLNGRV